MSSLSQNEGRETGEGLPPLPPLPPPTVRPCPRCKGTGKDFVRMESGIALYEACLVCLGKGRILKPPAFSSLCATNMPESEAAERSLAVPYFGSSAYSDFTACKWCGDKTYGELRPSETGAFVPFTVCAGGCGYAEELV